MKRTIRENYRIEVQPDLWGYTAITLNDDAKVRAICADIEKAIRQHVDGVEGVSTVCDTRFECSHCGYEWEVLTAEEAADPECQQDVHSTAGEPVCCEAAINEFRAERDLPALATPEVTA